MSVPVRGDVAQVSGVDDGQGEQLACVGAGSRGDVPCRLAAQFSDRLQHFGDERRLIALAAMVHAGLVRRIAFQQQVFDWHLRHDAAQPLCTWIGDGAADAEMEAKPPQLTGLLFAAGKAVHHTADAGVTAQRQDHFFKGLAGVNDHRQVALARQGQLRGEASALQSRRGLGRVEIQPDLADGDTGVSVAPGGQCGGLEPGVGGHKQWMEAISGETPVGGTCSQGTDTRPTGSIYRRHHHLPDPRSVRASDDIVTVGVERAMIEMDVAVDEHGKGEIPVGAAAGINRAEIRAAGKVYRPRSRWYSDNRVFNGTEVACGAGQVMRPD